MSRFRRILHATDFSTASAPAFAEALALARQERAELRLVHVMTPPAMFLEDSYLSARTFREMQSQARRADLIVVGTHGRSGFARAILGSVAARVVTLARCPVLTVRGR